MSLSSRLKRTQSTADEPKETELPPEEEEEVKIDFDVQSIIESLGDDNEDSWESVLFITDYDLSPDIRLKLERHIKITTYDEKLFLNRSLAYMYQQNIKNIWVNISDDSARKYISKNITKTPKYKVVLSYEKSKSKWVEQLSKFADLTLQKKDIAEASYLNIAELFSELKDSAFAISKPFGNCLERLFNAHVKKTPK
jgi:hypothetical protein